MRAPHLALALALFAGASPHCGRREDEGRSAVTARHVEDELERRGIEGVEVTIDGDAVVLSGRVRSESERTRAQSIARDASGMVEVRDRLSVRP